MVDIEINDKKLEVEQGSMIIEAADAAGIRIPRFCYHKKLSVAANCRMCLVEVEKLPKPVPACATPVTAGMKVYTCSAKALDAQRAVMEFLLINHPLDCPICDQGGECELQDLSLGYGQDISRFTEGKRTVKDKDIGPLIATDMTRCIHCTRCVRFGQEIAGIRELGAIGRGENMSISTFIEHSLISEMSGNIIDLCPVGALTSKPFRFTARAWELGQYPTIAPHDCVGSALYGHTRRNEVMRIVPKENEAINEMWISDRDRYSYTALKSDDRLAKPMIKLNGEWQEIEWQAALQYIVSGLQHIIQDHGPENIGAIVSPNTTVEESYLVQKLWRALGSHNIDHRIRQLDFNDQTAAPSYYGLPIPINQIEKMDFIFLIGSNTGREQPIINHRIRKGVLQGSKVACLNPIDFNFNFNLDNKIICHPDEMVIHLAGIAKALALHSELNAEHAELLSEINPTETHIHLAETFKQAKESLVLLGALAINHPLASTIRSLATLISQLTNAKIGFLTDGVNSAGAWLAGVIPHRLAAGVPVENVGLNAQEMLSQSLKAYLLLGVEPELDMANSGLTLAALNKADFVIALSPFKSAGYLEYADVILPIAPFTETSGTYVNGEGKWQSFTGMVTPYQEVRPAWKVLRVLGNLLELTGFEYSSTEEIREEVKQLTHVMTVHTTSYLPLKITKKSLSLTRITEWPIYRSDNLVRRALPLQLCAIAEIPAVYMHSSLAQHYQVSEGDKVLVKQHDTEVELPVIIDERVYPNTVLIPAGFMETAALTQVEGPINIRRLTC
ncbi:MAG: NADH-quinone oxidoreductase chain 3 [Legionellaceae bacterium]